MNVGQRSEAVHGFKQRPWPRGTALRRRELLNGGNWNIVAKFTEVESGRKADRPELDRALAAACLHRCPLVVSKVDPPTRSVAFLSRLLEANVDMRFADLPQIERATGRLLLQQMVAVAELEAGRRGTVTAHIFHSGPPSKPKTPALGGQGLHRLPTYIRPAAMSAK